MEEFEEIEILASPSSMLLESPPGSPSGRTGKMTTPSAGGRCRALSPVWDSSPSQSQEEDGMVSDIEEVEYYLALKEGLHRVDNKILSIEIITDLIGNLPTWNTPSNSVSEPWVPPQVIHGVRVG